MFAVLNTVRVLSWASILFYIIHSLNNLTYAACRHVPLWYDIFTKIWYEIWPSWDQLIAKTTLAYVAFNLAIIRDEVLPHTLHHNYSINGVSKILSVGCNRWIFTINEPLLFTYETDRNLLLDGYIVICTKIYNTYFYNMVHTTIYVRVESCLFNIS